MHARWDTTFIIIVFIISSGRGAPKSVFVARWSLDVAIDAAIVYYEGETGRVPIFSIPRLSVGIFMKLGFVTIDRNESQKLTVIGASQTCVQRVHELIKIIYV